MSALNVLIYQFIEQCHQQTRLYNHCRPDLRTSCRNRRHNHRRHHQHQHDHHQAVDSKQRHNPALGFNEKRTNNNNQRNNNTIPWSTLHLRQHYNNKLVVSKCGYMQLHNNNNNNKHTHTFWPPPPTSKDPDPLIVAFGTAPIAASTLCTGAS